MQYVWLALVMFGNPHRLYPVNIFSGNTRGNLPLTSAHTHAHTLVRAWPHLHTCTPLWMYAHTHTVVGKWPWKAGLNILLRNCSVFKHHVAVAQFHLDTLKVSKVLSLSPHLFSYSLELSGCWFCEWFLFSFLCSSCSKLVSSRVLTHLDCFYVRRT